MLTILTANDVRYKEHLTEMTFRQLHDLFGGLMVAEMADGEERFWPRGELSEEQEQVLERLGKRVVDGYQEFIQLAIPPNKDIRKALEAACERVNDRKLRRNGLVLRLSVGPPASGQTGRSRATF